MPLAHLAELELAHLKPVEPDSSLDFEQLVLPKGHQDLITCLVEQHFAHGRNEKGLTLLLHGPPGMGKRTTAGMRPFSSQSYSDN